MNQDSINAMSYVSDQVWAFPMWTIFAEIQLFNLILLCKTDTCPSSFQNGEISLFIFCKSTEKLGDDEIHMQLVQV